MTVKVVTVVKDDLIGLQRTTKSVREQSIPVSWILVIPNTPSNTRVFAESLKAQGIVQDIIDDEGLGVYPAMNISIWKSHPDDWIWFLNAGDTFAAKDSYNIVNHFIEKTTCKWIYGGHFLGTDSGTIIGEVPAPIEFEASNQLFAHKYVSHQSVVFNSRLLKLLDGFDDNFKIAADWELMVRASKICKGERIPEFLSVFYMGGLSTINRQRGNLELLKIRHVNLPKKYVFKSYFWFLYRSMRNFLVQKVEVFNPEAANAIRKFRFKLRKLWRDPRDNF